MISDEQKEVRIKYYLSTLPIDTLESLKKQYEHDIHLVQQFGSYGNYDPQISLRRINEELSERENVDL